MCVLPAFMSAPCTCWVPVQARGSEKEIGSPGTRVIEGPEPLCGCWELALIC